MTSATINTNDKVWFTRDCGKTWAFGTLTGFNEKHVTVETKATEQVLVKYGFLSLRKRVEKQTIVTKHKIAYNEACQWVYTPAQYKEYRATLKAEQALYNMALKYAS